MNVLETYYISIISCILIHAVYCAIFFVKDLTILAYFNLGSTIFYTGLYIIAKKGYTYLSLGLMHCEVIIYTILATICLGWEAGFSYIMLCLIGTLFISSFKKSFTKYILAVIEILVFFLLKAYCIGHTAVYSYKVNGNFINAIFIYNSVIYFVEVLFLSVFFYNTTLWLQRKLFKQNNLLKYLASTDQLTKLFNRRSMKNFLDESYNDVASRGIPFSISICDIDNFKKINDTYGHQCGDFVLSTVASIILNITRETDKVCRWGGEEFLIIYQNTDIKSAFYETEKIRKAVEDYNFVYKNYKMKITMTFGVCDSKKFGTVDSMITEADRLLYKGKKNGKNCTKY